MIRPIVKDPLFLARVSEEAKPSDADIVPDLFDTLRAHSSECVGMAANMIGVSKRVIIVDDNGRPMIMFNPVIVSKSGPYDTEEGCLSLPGTRPVKRYTRIKVRWADAALKPHSAEFSGFTAQIIQHECDHLEGRLI